jgi:hypothetical protein
MLKMKPNLNVVAVLAAIVGLVFVIGCGDSPEKVQMTEFIKEFGTAVEQYAKAEDGIWHRSGTICQSRRWSES